MPDLYIITGANGAGKSTFGSSYLPTHLQNDITIFDGDKLSLVKRKELYPAFTPSMKEARRIADNWLHEFFEEQVAESIATQKDFIYEGHLPENGNWVTPERFKKAGYVINFIFLGLSDTNLSSLRVFERAKLGGHNVPPYEIERNFYGNLYQINKRFASIDILKIIDTSVSANPQIVAFFEKGKINFALHEEKLPDWFKRYMPNLYKIIID